MNLKNNLRSFVPIDKKIIVIVGVLSFIPDLVLSHFGFRNEGPVASYMIMVLILLIYTSRPLLSNKWVFIALFIFILTHIIALLSITWPDRHYPALAIGPFAIVDFIAMKYIVKIIDKRELR